jgi:hypothetical protein
MALIHCLKCTMKIQVPPCSTAQRVRCPFCSTIFEVGPTSSTSSSSAAAKPAAPSASGPSTIADEITFACPHCGARQKALRENAGKLVKCTNLKCQKLGPIPSNADQPGRSAMKPVPLPGAAGPPRPAERVPQPARSPGIRLPGPATPAVRKNAWWLRSRAAVVVGALLIASAAIAGGLLLRTPASVAEVNDASTQSASSVESATAPVSEFAFINTDARAIFSIRVADLWNSPPLQKAWNSLPPELQAQATQVSRQYGFDMADYERVTVVLLDETSLKLWAVLRTTQPFDKAKCDKLLAGAKDVQWEPRTHDGFPYFLGKAPPGSEGPSEPLAVYAASDRIFVVGTEEGVFSALAQTRTPNNTGKLAHVLPLLEKGQDHFLAAAVMRDADQLELPKGFPVGLSVRVPPDVKATLLQARFESMLQLKGTMTYASAQQANDARQRFEDLKGLGQPLIRFGDATGAKDPRADLLKVLTAIKTEVSGCDFILHAELDLARLAPALPQLVASQAQFQERVTGSKNLKQLALAFEQFHAANGHYPQAIYSSADGKPLYSWRVALLPFLGEQQLYDSFDKEKAWNDTHNDALLKRMPKVFKHPAMVGDQTDQRTCFQLLTGRNTALGEGRIIKKTDLGAGPGRVPLLVEHRQIVPWTAPMDVVVADNSARMEAEVMAGLVVYPDDTFLVALFDGSVRSLKRRTKAEDFLHALDPRVGLEPPAD